jgi:adenosylcobinamide kinase/adenosylcobinamide-phosphate guanylyltransferase
MSLTFITGPVRSGKSRFAERLARDVAGDVTYVATARSDPEDPEWVARLAHHAARRPPHWRLVETASPHAPLLTVLAAQSAGGETLVIDSVGTWLADRMTRRLEAGASDAPLDAGALEAEADDLVGALLACAAHAIVVGEEVGWGVVPPFLSGRVFRDVLGRAQQRLARGAGRAYLVVAGFAVDLHAWGEPVDASHSLDVS